MLVRTISGVLAALLALGVVFSQIIWLKLIVVSVLVVIGTKELAGFHAVPLTKLKISWFYVTTLMISTSLALQGPEMGLRFLFLGFGLLSILSILSANHSGKIEQEVRALMLNCFGLIYITAICGFLIPLTELYPLGPQYCLLLFLIVFVGDSSAYFIGKMFGRTKLSPILSPKKTLKGSAAALVASLCVTLVWSVLVFEDELTRDILYPLMISAPIFSLLAQLGDLLESMLKRSSEVKDSGSFLPGHGGVLDRLDGLALTAPVFYFFIQWVQKT